MTLEEFKKKSKKIPDTPGVYFFLGKQKELLYIGKATSLKSRVRSYFASDLHKTRGPIITSMVEKAKSIDWRQTDSVLEALILEANLIRTHKPFHNTDLKDDKSFNYVVITKEDFPRVLLVRGKELEALHESKSSGVHDFPAEKSLNPRAVALRSLPQTSFVSLHTFGPFPHGTQLKEALKIIRKIFPYRDICTPGVGKPCFNRHIGLCPGVCSGEIAKTEYKKIIKRITLLFQGKKNVLLKSLESDMKTAAKKEEFEEAVRLRGQVFALNHIQDVSLIKDEYRNPLSGPGTARAARIEGYDAAHLGGTAAVGVMVVVQNGLAQKADYRLFHIKEAKPGDDVGALREILSRRLNHTEWPYPRAIVIDGGAGQMNAAKKVLQEFSLEIPLIGVVKDERHRPRAIRGLSELLLANPALGITERDVLLVNGEAHRFAITHHRKLRSRRQGL